MILLACPYFLYKDVINIKILAFDQASRHTAFSVGINGKLADYGELKATGDGDDRIYQMSCLIKNKIQEVKPDAVYIENIQLQSGNVSTYQMLARLQGMIIWITKELAIPLEIIPPVTWKATIGICKGKRDEQKRKCIEYVENTYKINLFDNNDIADSIGILTHAMMTTE